MTHITQPLIISALQAGAKLLATEGKNPKAWLNYPNGSQKDVDFDIAQKALQGHEDNLIFGEKTGIRWKSLS